MVEETLSTELLYAGRLITVRRDKVRLSNGTESYRELVDHQPAVVILALDTDHHVFFVKQYRKPIESVLLELPAGCVMENETSLAAAKRELQEECGCCADVWTPLISVYPTPGFCNEQYHFFVAQQLSQTEQRLDDDELLSVHRYSLTDYETLVVKEQLQDAKTVLGYFLLREFLRR